MFIAGFDSGVSVARMKEMQRAALTEFNTRGGDIEAAPARSIPDPEDGTVVSYTYRIDENGIPQQYTGIAGDAASVPTLHEKARSRAGAFEDGSSTAKAGGSGGLTTQSSSWDNILHDEADFCEDPYGCTTNNFDLLKLSEDGDSYQDAYAIDQFFVMEPGYQKYDSNWVNYVGTPMHDWRENDMGYEDLDEYDPVGTHDGSQTMNVSVGTGGVSLGWQYTQPAVTTIDNSSPSSNYAKWDEEFNTWDAQTNTNGMEPGSSCWIDQENDGSGYYDLMDLVAKGDFEDSGWMDRTYYLKHTWHIDVYY